MKNYQQHEIVRTPNWDTKIRCECGLRFSNRMEFYLHRGDAYKNQLEDDYDLVDFVPYEETPLDMIQESYERKGRSLPSEKRNH